MDLLQQINWFLNNLMQSPQTRDIITAIKTTQSAIRFYQGQPYERATIEEVKITMDIVGKVFKKFAHSQQEIDSIDFAVNFSKIMFDVLANQSQNHVKTGF